MMDKKNLEKYQKAIETSIKKSNYGQNPVELYEPIRYIMALGGKRIRPLLCLLSTQLFTKNWKKSIQPAIAIEVFHNFTLMHDDIMDAAPLRRGMATVHEKWDTNTAILSGDVMLIKAYDFLLECPKKQLLSIIQRFNKTAAEVCEGQQLDMNFAQQSKVSIEDYIEMIRLKTAVLLGFSMELGAILANQKTEMSQELYRAGTEIGIGFQLMDDILDVYGNPEKFGKQVGGDIIENKKTYLLLKALEKAQNTPFASKIEQFLNNKDVDTSEKIKGVTAIYNELGIKAEAEKQMNAYFEKGIRRLKNISADETAKKYLISFIENLIHRES